MSNSNTVVRYGNAVQTTFEVPGSLNKVAYVDGVLTSPASSDFQSITFTVAPGAGIPVEIEYDSEVIPVAGDAVPSTTTPSVYFGTGAPGITAPKGSLYLRTDGSSVSTRMYVNSDGADTWVAITTAS